MKGVRRRKRKMHQRYIPCFLVLTTVVCIFMVIYLSNIFNAYGEKNIASTFNVWDNNSGNTPISQNKDTAEKHIVAMKGLSQENIPTGCESVSTVAVLRYYGVNITPEHFISSYLPMEYFYKKNGRVYGANPSKAFAGNPYEKGSLGCYCEVIEDTCVNMQESNYKGMGKLKVKAERGEPLSKYEEYILKDKPVIIWATIDMKESRDGFTYYLETGEKYVWKANEHCVVLCGFDDEKYYIMDPLRDGKVAGYEKSLVKARYEEMGKQAVLIEVADFTQE